MANKAPKRKLNRKSKRMIRRSFAAVLMATAIGVAAIPVPDIQADTETEDEGGLSSGIRDSIVADAQADPDYSSTCTYVVDETDDLNMDPDKVLELTDTDTVYNSYTIQKVSSGKWEVNWQFKYYTRRVNDGESGIISKYNNLYQENEVTLSNNATRGYYIVTQDMFNDFYEDPLKGGIVYSINYKEDFLAFISAGGETSPSAQKSDEANWLEEHFNEEFTAFWNACMNYYKAEQAYNKYLVEYEEWVNNGMVGTEPVKPALQPGVNLQEPGSISGSPSKFPIEKQYTYYCDNDAALSKFGTGFTLIDATDRVGFKSDGTVDEDSTDVPSGGNASTVYVVSAANANVVGGATKDANGFLVTKVSVGIIGIGDEAFKDVKNVDILNIPQEIKYIGDDAFFGSFIKEITFVNVQNIGNRAFKNCTQLKNVNLGSATISIGAESFYNTGIVDIVLPYSVEVIGAGAFAGCRALETVDMTAVSNTDIREFAFYNDVELDSVNMSTTGIYHIGMGCFAVSSGVMGSWTDVVLPNGIKSTVTIDGEVKPGLENWIFAGRSNLNSVVFPGDYGLSEAETVTIPSGMFKGCTQLSFVEFPDQGNNSCGYVTFPKYLFLDVTNPEFYVRGPEKKADGSEAMPRMATWVAITSVSDFVPYVYKNKDGVDCYEVSDGTYLLQADTNGLLTQCTLVNTSITEIDLVITSYVGNIKIVGISTDCFSDEELLEKIRSITVEDDSITEIGDNAFSDLPNLEWIDIGNSVTRIGANAFSGCTDKFTSAVIGGGVTEIGDNAFSDCPGLTDITFESPINGYDSLTLGNEAFKTGSSKLTIHGDIQKGYAPFEWSMNPENVIDGLGTRVCYESLAPTYLKVIYDNNTGHVTLVDYPKYDRLDDDHSAHNVAMEKYYYKQYGAEKFNANRESFKTAWTNATTDEERAAIYESADYGPWVNDALCVELMATGNAPEPYFTHNPYSIIENCENGANAIGDWQTTTLEEEAWINSTKNIVVPEGIDSIDIYQYIKGEGSSSNQQNVQKYLVNSSAYGMYTTPGNDPADEVTAVPGLFSGFYEDYDTTSEYELKIRGNDRIESISLSSVKSLPDYAFDSCERLTTVVLGPECADIGIAPFRGCENLSVVGDNDYYKYENGILYSVNEDGSYTIEECLASRGKTVGQSIINQTNDPKLENVSSIAPGAFEECNYITNVDFSTATKLKTIPERAFKNCAVLSYVTLPETVDRIEAEAFKGDDRLTITIPGIEVHIATDAMEHSSTVCVRTYEDSAAYEYADYHGLSIQLIGDKYRVLFLDHDGTLLCEPQYITSGGTATPPEDPVREGYKFIGWSGEYINVVSDLDLVAQYEPVTDAEGDGDEDGDGDGNNNDNNNNDNDGNNNNDGNGGNGGNTSTDDGKFYTVTVINGSGGGSYKAGSTVIVVASNPPSGKVFDKWTSGDGITFTSTTITATTFKMPAKNVTVTANYKAGGSSGGSSVSGGNSSNKGNSNLDSGTKVTINKPGISNTNMASATVNGSTDSYIVKISETTDATQAVEAALTNEYGSLENIKYFAMDITLWDSKGTTKITDTRGISVDITIPIPDSLVVYAGNNKAAGVVNNKLDKLSPRFSTIDGVPCITFTATHFSPYAIYVETNNLIAGDVLDSTPKTGDGIHPKWFLATGLACVSVVLFLKKDKAVGRRKPRFA